MSTLKTNNIQHVDLADPSILLNSDGSVSIAGTVSYEDATNVDSVGVVTARKQLHVGTGVSIAAGGLNVTAGITTLGSDLQVQGDLSIIDKIYHAGDTNTMIRFPAADTFTVETGGSERLRIDSSGRMGLGVNSPAHKLHVADATTPELIVEDTTNNVKAVVGADNSVARIGSDTNHAVTFRVNDTEKVRIDTSGQMGVGMTPTRMFEVKDSTGANRIANLRGTGTSGAYLAFLDANTTDDSKCRVGSAGGNNLVMKGDTVQFATGAGSEFGRFTANGSLLLGTTTDTQRLHVYNGGGAAGYKTALFNSNDTTNGTRVVIGNTGNASGRGLGIMVGGNYAGVDKASFGWFNTDSTFAAATIMTITSDSKILMGGTDVYGTFENSSTSPRLQVRGTNLNGSCQAWIRATADAGAPKLFLANTRNTSGNSHTVVQNGDELGGLFFAGSDGSQFVNGASITSNVDGSPGADDVPGYLSFGTNSGGTGTTERMRINADGQIDIMQNAAYMHFRSQGGFLVPAIFQNTGNNTNKTMIEFRGWNSTTSGSISTRVNVTTYSTSSDARLKENIVDTSNGIERVKQLRPVQFNFIENKEQTIDGFLAQEARNVVPVSVTGDPDEVDKDGKMVPMGMDNSKLVPVLTKALQEAIAKIETLETEVAALKGS